MCIRDRAAAAGAARQLGVDLGDTVVTGEGETALRLTIAGICLLYTSDAADDLLCVDLGGRRIIKKKQTTNIIIRLVCND